MYGINDPSALLRPFKDLKHFTEELYAMFSKPSAPGGQSQSPSPTRPGVSLGGTPGRSAPGDQSGGINSIRETRIEQARSKTILPEPAKKSSHEGSRRKNEVQASDSPSRGENATPGRPSEIASPPDIKRPTRESSGGNWVPPQAAPAPPSSRARNQPAPSAHDGTSKRIEYPSIDATGPKLHELGPFPPLFDIGDFANQVGGGGGSPIYIGKVVSGSGDTYKVDLYPNGPLADPGDTVSVGIIQINEEETIPPGTWLSSIFYFAPPANADPNKPNYFCQPPIWLS